MFELEQRKKELSNPSPFPAAAIPPTGHITVRKVYLDNKQAFKVGPDRDNFLRAAGKIAKETYTAKHGAVPPVIQEGPFQVTCYPKTDEQLIKEALNSAMRKLHGQSGTITAYMPVIVSMQNP